MVKHFVCSKLDIT